MTVLGDYEAFYYHHEMAVVLTGYHCMSALIFKDTDLQVWLILIDLFSACDILSVASPNLDLFPNESDLVVNCIRQFKFLYCKIQ